MKLQYGAENKMKIIIWWTLQSIHVFDMLMTFNYEIKTGLMSALSGMICEEGEVGVWGVLYTLVAIWKVFKMTYYS